jgi:ABC-2 type transport system ATP-binding protein
MDRDELTVDQDKKMREGKSPDTVLRTQSLVKRFGNLVAVDGLTLDVYKGEVFGILGPNGAGKTTSINMMCGLWKPDEGQVFIHGQPVHGGSKEAVLKVGVCPQEIVLWENLTCLEQLIFIGEMYGVSRRAARDCSKMLLEVVGLQDKSHKLVKTLSGGMKRRLNLVMALVHDPEILVLDEPEAGLDPQSRILVREYIRTLAHKKTVILTTHNMDEADRMADRVAIIDQGRLLALDTPKTLKHRVGEGDVLEIEIVSSTGISLGGAVEAISRITPDVSAAGNALIIRALGVVELLSTILEVLKEEKFQSGEVRLRENTLEDVFIALTGRRLRE